MLIGANGTGCNQFRPLVRELRSAGCDEKRRLAKIKTDAPPFLLAPDENSERDQHSRGDKRRRPHWGDPPGRKPVSGSVKAVNYFCATTNFFARDGAIALE